MNLQEIKEKLSNQGYNVTIPINDNRIKVMGYGKGYFKVKKAKANSIVNDLKSMGYNAVSKRDIDGYYDFWVFV